MAKTNFTKAEEALAQALDKMTKNRLWELASGGVPVNEEIKARVYLLFGLELGIKRLTRILGNEAYKKIGTTKKALEKLSKDIEKLSPEQVDKLKEIKAKVDAENKALPEPSAEELIEKERHKHINKRFNVSDKWLPLK